MITEDFAAYAARLRIGFSSDVPAIELQRMLESFMSGLAMDCLEAGTRLIGHIKCLVETGDEIIACSVTDHDARVRCRGKFDTSRSEVDLIVNVLQYGLKKKDLVRIVSACGKRSFVSHASISIEDLEIEEKELIQLS
ncbi:MAG: hypothetical protein AB9860_06205 [Methanomassiliicoccales archaeon]